MPYNIWSNQLIKNNSVRTSIIISTFLFFFGSLQAQLGCTDSQATNYDAAATINDGSCLYPVTAYTLGQIAELPDELIENSGLVHLPEGLYTQNDAGNPNEIYRIDPLDGSIQQTLLVIGTNTDWEDMAQSETHIYLGDFGNNDGDRTDLRIYKIDKGELGNNVLNAQPINFSFADQIDFSENNNNHDYDCEAFFFHDDSLHLFTKNWSDNQTRHYAIPAEPGFHNVLPKFTFNVDGLITSADISEEGTIVLLGYTEVGLNFMWLLYDYTDNFFFSGNKRRIELGSGLVNSQTEAITFKDNESGYISSEQFDLGSVELPPRLMSFNIDQWVNWPMVSTIITPLLAGTGTIKAFPNPFSDELTLKISKNWSKSEMELRLFDINGKLLLSQEFMPSESELILKGLNDFASGMYTIQVISKEHFWQGKVVK